MGPGWAALVPQPKPDPERVRLEKRVIAALERGWSMRYDLERGSYFAARELHEARTLDALLDKVDEADNVEAPQ